MTVRYDVRQLQYLKALGIVPWVMRDTADVSRATAPSSAKEKMTSRSSGISAPPPSEAFPSPDPEPASVRTVASATPATEGFPDGQAALARMLVDIDVSVVPRRGASAEDYAVQGRVILILESRHTSGAAMPIDGHVWDLDKDEEQLLMAMLASIGLGENDLCRAVPAEAADPGPDASNAAVRVGELHRQLPRLVVLLLNRLQPSTSPAQHRLDGDNGVIGWRLHHPALLLANPERKREAWDVLKAMRQLLSPSH